MVNGVKDLSQTRRVTAVSARLLIFIDWFIH